MNILAARSLSFGLYSLALVIGMASTHQCIARDHLGSGCLVGIAVLLAWLSGWVFTKYK
jgi:hypothetical protein